MTNRNPPAKTADEEFRYWSKRSWDETAQSLAAHSDVARDAHWRLAVLCIRRALTYATAASATCGPNIWDHDD